MNFPKKIAGLSLLQSGGPIETVSNLPGRVRFRCPVLVGRPDLKALLSDNLSKLPGLQSAEITEITGSVLIHYHSEKLTPELLFTALLKILNLEDEFLRPSPPQLAMGLQALGDNLDRGFYHMTAGLVDLRTAFLVALAVYGLYKWNRDRADAFPGGITLLWWAYDSLIKGRDGDT